MIPLRKNKVDTTTSSKFDVKIYDDSAQKQHLVIKASSNEELFEINVKGADKIKLVHKQFG